LATSAARAGSGSGRAFVLARVWVERPYSPRLCEECADTLCATSAARSALTSRPASLPWPAPPAGSAHGRTRCPSPCRACGASQVCAAGRAETCSRNFGGRRADRWSAEAVRRRLCRRRRRAGVCASHRAVRVADAARTPLELSLLAVYPRVPAVSRPGVYPATQYLMVRVLARDVCGKTRKRLIPPGGIVDSRFIPKGRTP
jgi:hypothetical protein